jgi:hypothetical protein
MFDYAERLRLEYQGPFDIEALELLVNCYLATLSSMSLVEPEHAWLYFSPPHEVCVERERERERERVLCACACETRCLAHQRQLVVQVSRKRKRGEETSSNEPIEGKIFTLSDVQQSYLLAISRLQLVKYSKKQEHIGMHKDRSLQRSAAANSLTRQLVVCAHANFDVCNFSYGSSINFVRRL